MKDRHKWLIHNRKRKIFYVLLFTLILPLFTSCKNKKIDGEVLSEVLLYSLIPTVTPVLKLTPIPTPAKTYEGMAKSLLTGEWIPEEDAKKRPFAVVFNNITVSSPQSGIGDADILYEALVEAGITRLMGIYGVIRPDSLTAERLGSIRSARHYFVSFASEYDAILIHFGQTTYATKKMKALNTDHLGGTEGYGVNSFYRDKTIKAPHNAFASLEGIEKGINSGKFRTELSEDQEGHFNFYEEDTMLSSDTLAETVTLSFSGSMQPYFVYDTELRLYTRYQFNGVHTDYNTKEALQFKNIIIQFVKQWDIDKNGYQTMDLLDVQGDGYYITNGFAMPITWKKKESAYFMRYYDESGNELTINTGKTYIAVFPNHRAEKITLE